MFTPGEPVRLPAGRRWMPTTVARRGVRTSLGSPCRISSRQKSAKSSMRGRVTNALLPATSSCTCIQERLHYLGYIAIVGVSQGLLCMLYVSKCIESGLYDPKDACCSVWQLLVASRHILTATSDCKIRIRNQYALVLLARLPGRACSRPRRAQ